MEKRPWHIDIIGDDDTTQYKPVKKSRAMGLSCIPYPSPDNVLAQKKHYSELRDLVYKDILLAVPYSGEEDRDV
ncbi:terminase large subunit [Bacillus phage Bastille]|uniref:Uncharacterized protein n=1 Tax=Bacillus phage Bastille TaxID=57477 RepID=J9PKV9_9CAUD|nr:terminase large subunit [Bacillus phage Bastille]AEQ34198.1 hypothetical protein [Bacillus phage Bastille]